MSEKVSIMSEDCQDEEHNRSVLSETSVLPVGRIHQRVDLKLAGIKKNRALLCWRRFRAVGRTEAKEKVKKVPRACYLFNNQKRQVRDAPPSCNFSDLSDSRCGINSWCKEWLHF